MKIYAFEYCSCIYESTFGIQSLHMTKRGAYKAMRTFILKKWGVDFVANNKEEIGMKY
jgi:hypothetical protein